MSHWDKELEKAADEEIKISEAYGGNANTDPELLIRSAFNDGAEWARCYQNPNGCSQKVKTRVKTILDSSSPKNDLRQLIGYIFSQGQHSQFLNKHDADFPEPLWESLVDLFLEKHGLKEEANKR